MVQDAFTILIADRNPHVREFLRREFLGEGYRVKLAKNGMEVLKVLRRPGRLDVLVLDLDLPDTNGSDVLDTLKDRIPNLPVVLHCFAPETEEREGPFMRADAFVEKQGNSVDTLKRVVRDLLPTGKWSHREAVESGSGPGPTTGGTTT